MTSQLACWWEEVFGSNTCQTRVRSWASGRGVAWLEQALKVIYQEEAYTSKCSFLDLETIGKHTVYLGKRLTRSLFRAADGRIIHADVNAAYNLIRKALPAAFAHGLQGVVVRPWRLTVA